MGKKRKLTFVDLFAGCGGLSLGLELTDFVPVFVNELNVDAMETYLLNREHENPLLRSKKFHSYDIRQLVDDRKLLDKLKRSLWIDRRISDEEIDLVVGGPPCQGFSGIGHRRSYSVEKKEVPSNFLYRCMADVIRRLKPRAFLFENVRGILFSRWTERGKKGEIWDDVRTTFDSIPGYDIDFDLVFAKDYGVPQNRPRVLMVGFRKDVGFKPSYGRGGAQRGFLPQPADEPPPHLIELLGDLEDPQYSNGGRTCKYPHPALTSVQKQLRTSQNGRKIFAAGDALVDQEYSDHSARIVEKFRAMHANGGVIPEEYRTKKFAQRVLPARWNGEGPTITATSLADDYVHYSQPRSLTVREWARLQMFPDWYRFAGKRTTGGLRRAGNPQLGMFDRELPKYTQIGNAVPVRLAQKIGEHLAEILRR